VKFHVLARLRSARHEHMGESEQQAECESQGSKPRDHSWTCQNMRWFDVKFVFLMAIQRVALDARVSDGSSSLYVDFEEGPGGAHGLA